MKAYPVPAKAKSALLCEAFIEGAGVDGEKSDAAVFYGITEANLRIWRLAIHEGRDWYYLDNSYFDVSRGTYFRVTKNRLQHNGWGRAPAARRDALGLKFSPWRANGSHVLLVPQSADFMRDVARYDGDWTQKTVAELSRHTTRELRVRPWSDNKKKLAGLLAENLRDCWTVVTWSSAAAVTGLLEGIPAFVGSPQCAAWSLGGWGLQKIETPRLPHYREDWAAVLACNQWTIDEMRSGLAWRMLNA